ncbi:MAG TPA: DUF1007 family protein [Hyphomicrobiaceae bacterium]|nr:DUF1007 family protein [Hyphomicrobiaceae bacterium]
MKRQQAQRSAVAALALSAALLTAASTPAAAHPHVWVTVQSTLVYEQGSLVAIKHKWTFDEYYAAMATQGLDTNNDGKLDRSELDELAKVNMDGLKEFSYFTYPKLAGQDLALGEPKDYYLEYVEAPAGDRSEPPVTASNKSDQPANAKVLSLYFTLPLKQPVLAEAPGFSFTVADPSFFIAFEFAKRDPVKFGPGAPADCRVQIGDSKQDAEDAKRLGEAFSKQIPGQAVSMTLGKPVHVSCGPKS